MTHLQIRVIEFIRYVPTQPAIFLAFMDDSIEEAEAKKQVLPGRFVHTHILVESLRDGATSPTAKRPL